MFLDLDVELRQGTFTLKVRERIDARSLGLFGPSGSGKTTLVEAIAGLRTPNRGHIRIGDRVLFSAADALDVPVQQRRLGYVPQDLALFPHMSVRRNVLYGDSRGTRLQLDRVVHVLDIGDLLTRRVQDLSGGERQRVAVARALMSSPDLLLLDEPLASVDVELRKRVVPYLQRIRDDLQVPIVYVSHDEQEVRAIASWIVRLERGQVTSVVRSAEPF
jgi:molybdate transport system ATP-binding protein